MALYLLIGVNRYGFTSIIGVCWVAKRAPKSSMSRKGMKYSTISGDCSLAANQPKNVPKAINSTAKKATIM